MHFLKAEILLCEGKGGCQAGVSDGVTLKIPERAQLLLQKGTWQVIGAHVAQLLFCTWEETIKTAEALNFKELTCSYSKANFQKEPST